MMPWMPAHIMRVDVLTVAVRSSEPVAVELRRRRGKHATPGGRDWRNRSSLLRARSAKQGRAAASPLLGAAGSPDCPYGLSSLPGAGLASRT